MTKRLTNLLGAGLVAGAGLLSGGCADMTNDEMLVLGLGVLGAGSQISPYSTAQQKVMGGMLSSGANAANNLQSARAGKTQVNVNTSNSENRSNRVAPYYSFFTTNGLKDINEDDKIGEGEIFGRDKKKFNIDKEQMHVIFLSNITGRVVFRSYTSEGKLIGETPVEYSNSLKYRGYGTGPDGPESGDFMDNIKGAGPGDYRITITTPDKKLFYLDVSVERDKTKTLDKDIQKLENAIKDFPK